MGVSGYYPVIIRLLSGIRSSFSPDRYPVDYYPVLSSVRQNSIRHIPTENKPTTYTNAHLIPNISPPPPEYKPTLI
jgi:hypothetical protein